MKQRALKLLRAGAGSWSGAAAGAAMATAAGAGPIGLAGLLGIYAVCLTVETLADAAATDERISRIETWLEELVRRHGRLDEALEEIADGRSAHELVSRENARLLLEIRTASEERLETLLNANADAKGLLDSVSDYLSRLGTEVVATLEQQTALLYGIDASVRTVAADMSSVRVDLSEMNQRLPSEEDLKSRAADDQENCRLRIEKLQEHSDQMEWSAVEGFAHRCEAWLRRVRAGLPALEQARLLERLIEDATVRVKSGDGEKKAPALARLRGLLELCEPLVPQLSVEDQLRVSSHLAYAESIVNAPTAGLDLLKDRLDPYGLRRRLGILLDVGHLEEAWDLIRDETPAAEWVEKGIVAAGRAGQWEDAEQLLNWAIAHAPTQSQHMSRLMFVECAIHDGTNDVFGLRSDPPAEVASRLRRCVEILQPLIDGARVSAVPRHELDCAALRLSLALAAQLGDTTEMRRSVLRLSQRRPFDATLAHLAARGRIAADAGWAQRLRTEGSASFERRYLAAMLDSLRPELAETAFRAALRLAKEASTADEREQTLVLLFELAQQIGESAQRQVEDIAPGLREPGDRRWQLWAVARMFAKGDTSEADQRLEELRTPDDPLWLQIHGRRCLQLGDIVNGVGELSQAALAVNRPDFLDEVSSLAMSHRQWDCAASLLERLAALWPEDIGTRESRAMVFHKLGEDNHAADLFLTLAKDQPDVESHWLNAATCLVRAGRPEEAVESLETVCAKPEPPLQAVVGLAQILVERGRAKDAFSALKRHQERFWTQYEFVGSYWSVAFAAEEEGAGHEAFVQMRRLQDEGAAPEDVLVEKTLDDLLSMAKAHQEHRAKAAMDVLSGGVPWLMVAELQREPAYRAWAGRASTRPWIFEHPVAVSESAIYCSNGFGVFAANGSPHLEAIVSSGSKQPVVADLTALITLQKLDLLEAAADYCGRLHVPTSYLFKMFWDNNNLRPHQPSRRTAMDALRTAFANGRLHTGGGSAGQDLLELDEHYPHEHAPERVYHLTDLLGTIRTAGIATYAQLDRLAAVAHRPATASPGRDQIEAGDHLRIGLSTLSTLHTCEALDVVLQHFHIHVSDEDRQAILGESAWFESQEALRDDHNALWSFLRDDPRVERIGAAAFPEDPQDAPHDLALRALEISGELHLPLLADDRVLQAVALNSRPDSPSTSFGTAQLLRSMAVDEHITLEQYSTAILSLMEWRYRFILPDPNLLLHWARRSMVSVPGPNLQAVAQYQRACLRDPGLFSGLEPTDPPSTVALKFHQSIESAVGDFIGALWRDKAVPQERATAITHWSLAHLLPSPPATMEPRIRLTSDLRLPLFWMSLYLRLAQAPTDRPAERSRHALEVVGESLGMPFGDIVRVATEIIDGIADRRS